MTTLHLELIGCHLVEQKTSGLGLGGIPDSMAEMQNQK